jgi:hypothetical protein
VSLVQMIKWPSVYNEPQIVNAVTRLFSYDNITQGLPSRVLHMSFFKARSSSRRSAYWFHVRPKSRSISAAPPGRISVTFNLGTFIKICQKNSN